MPRSLLKNTPVAPIRLGETPRPTERQERSSGRAKPPAEPGVIQQAITPLRNWPTSILLALTVMVLCGAATSSVPVCRTAFCAPAAHLAGVLSGAPCVRDGADYRLVGPELDLTVVPACAAVDYFCMMAGFLSVLMSWHGYRLRAQLLVLPAAWMATILINAFRLTACWHTDRLAQSCLPPMLWPATHLAVGIITFLTGLILIFGLLTHGTAGSIFGLIPKRRT